MLGAGVCEQENIVRLKEVVKPFSLFSEVYNRYENASSVEIRITGRGWDAPLCRILKAGEHAVTEPAAQARLGCLFAFLASNGVQVIAETHCEHLVNRVRYEVYKKNLSAGSCVIHYKPDDKTSFSRLGINGRGHFVDPEGHETAFPAGFFDSTLSELLEMS